MSEEGRDGQTTAGQGKSPEPAQPCDVPGRALLRIRRRQAREGRGGGGERPTTSVYGRRCCRASPRATCLRPRATAAAHLPHPFSVHRVADVVMDKLGNGAIAGAVQSMDRGGRRGRRGA